MDPWYSGAVTDAVREAKSRRGVFVVYVRDDSENSQSTDRLWSECWTKLTDTSRIVALRLDKDSQACTQFMQIYRVQQFPTIYLINGQNGQVLKVINELLSSSEQLEQNLRDAIEKLDPITSTNTNASATTNDTASPDPVITATSEVQEAAASTQSKSVDERLAEARARLRELQDKREEEAKEKEKQDEIARRRLGQQMLLDKQKKEEELIRQRAEELRRDKLEQQQLQAKLKAQIEQDREEKRRKYEAEQNKNSSTVKPTVSTTAAASATKTEETEKIKVNYTRARLQFRLSDGSFFTEDFSCDAHMVDVYNYLRETLPKNQYPNENYILRTTHTRITLTRENRQTLTELELVPSAVLLVIPRSNTSASGPPANNEGAAQIFRPVSLFFAWLMIQLNFMFRFFTRTLFGNRAPEPTSHPSETSQRSRPRDDTPTVRRFRNAQDDQGDDDKDKRTWNGNSTQQM